MQTHRAFSLFACATAVIASAGLALAGDLNPPAGPVAPTMKKLDEVEPRIAVNATNTPGGPSAVFTITQPGSYYLTGNVTGVLAKYGIQITTSNVTLDLSGFSLVGVAGSLSGVNVGVNSRVTVRHGVLVSWASHGLTAVGGGGCVFEDLVAESCGGNGLDLGDNARVERCIARGNTSIGIRTASSGMISDCVANSNATGIEVNSGMRMSGCLLSGNTTRGILVGGSDAVVTGNTVRASTAGAIGIQVTGSSSTIESNTIDGTAAAGQVGLRITGSGNIVRGNLVSGTPDNYDFAAGNQLELLLSQIPESIDWSASVRLTGSLTGTSGLNGLTINADGVSVDLAGKELVGGGGAGTGIIASGSRRGVSVSNGAVRGWGSGGISLTSCVGPRVESISAAANTGAGIATNGGVITGCTSSSNTGAGVSGGDNVLVSRCTSINNGGDNIIVGGYASVIDCTASFSTGGHGVNASFNNCLVQGCTACANAMSGINAIQRVRVQKCVCSQNTLHGVHIAFTGAVEECYINQNAGDGILMDGGGAVTIRNNTISESNGVGDAGIRVTSAGGCHLEGNSVTNCTTGILVATGGNTVVRNSAMSNGTNFNIAGGNTAGPVINPAGAAAATNPLANYSN